MPKESVWDYPRPPRLEQTAKRIRVIFAGKTIADTTRAYRLLETSHPPTYYIPPEDVAREYLTLLPEQKTFCEFKGTAVYWTIKIGERRSEQAAWSYPEPAKNYLALKNHFAFYASRADACFVDDEQVQSQPGDFYGGWITEGITGPFKGAKGTSGW
ncbi:MAG: DUF427 domain-containing protein [Rhizobacter sp.]|nr:DUF427 domain-containing protein [Chlorobiales bacterium]